MDHSQTQRIVWITGASSGIGFALAERFASGGDVVVASSRSKQKLNALQNMIQSRQQQCEILTCDVQLEESVGTASREILEKYSSIDVLINNAGVTYFKNFASTTIQEFDHIINTNLRGSFLTTQSVLPSMLQQKQGLIINILSYVTKTTYTQSSVYSASKAGAEALMNGLRAEVRKEGIRIVNIYPGATATPIWRQSYREQHEAEMMQAADVADIVFDLSMQPRTLMPEELVLRPQIGDLNV